MQTFRLHRHAPTGSWIKLTSKAGRIAMALRVGANIVKTGRSAHIMALLIPPVEEPQQIKDEVLELGRG